MIKSLSVILHYIHCCYPNLTKCRQDTRLCVVVNVAYPPKVCIHHYYHDVIAVFKNSSISPKMIKIEGLGGKQIAYMILIKIQACHMGVIFIPKHMTWKRQQYMHTRIQIMRQHTGNGYCGVVPNVLALIFLTRKQMIRILTPGLQFIFMFIILFHVVHNMSGFR